MRTRQDSKNPQTPRRASAPGLQALVLAVGAAFMTETAPARTIHVNFTGGTAETGSALSGPAGGLGTTWNQFLGPNSPGTLVDSTGAATTVTITSNFGLTGTFDTPVLALPMLRGSMTNFGKGVDNTVITIGGLANGGSYDIWLVTLRNQPFSSGTPQGTEQYVGWWSTTNPTLSPANQLVDARGAAINTTTFVDGYNYVFFENVVANGSGQIVFTGVAGPLLDGSDNFHRLGLNGLQIQDATPVTAGPVDDAMSTVAATPAAVFANGVSASTVKVTLRDSNGVRVPNKEVTLANTAGPQDATIDPPTALTTSSQGEASFAVRSNTVGTEVFTATVVNDNLTLTDTASVEFTDPEAPVAFNVNFHAGSPTSGLLGVIGDPGETWNQGTTSASNLIDATGTVASSVNVTGLPDGQETVNAALNVFDANRNFFGKGANTTISITGLVPDTAYDLYIYSLSHNVASWGSSTDSERAAGDFVTTNTVLGNGQSQWLDNGKAGTNGSNFVANGNYIVFQSIISNGSGNISILVDAYDGINGVPGDGDGDCRLHINGLQIRPASGMSIDYMNWRSASYPGLGLPDEDDDGDGLSNRFEYIFGLNPTSGGSASPYPETPGLGNGFFRYTRRARSLINMDYKVWYSTDLENWLLDNAANQMVESAGNGVELVGVDIDPELLGENKLFLQIRTTPVTGLDPDPTLINLWGGGNTITLLFSKPMNPSSASNPDNYTITQDGVGTLPITNAVLSPDGGSVTLTLASALGTDTAYTVNLDRLTSATGQALGNNLTRQFRTWDDDPNGIKVFILAGQSNMVGYGNVETGATGAGTIGSLRYLAANNGSYPQYDYTSLLTNPANTASAFRTRSDVKVWWRDGGAGLGGTVRKGDLGPPFKGADNNYIGPEFAFGQVLGDFYADHDILLIKCAWGGRDLAEKFRPPSAVARVPGTQVGPFFSAIIDDARDVLDHLGTQFPEWSGKGYQIVGFAWHQGFNDRINTAFSNEYKNNLPDLISDIRTVFNKPNLPFVIASTGMDTGSPQAPPYAGYSAVEKAQLWVAGVPRPANVLSSDTRPFWRAPAQSPATSGQGFHWNHNSESYFLIGKALGDDMVDLLPP
jgi:alpha-galactosidase